MVKKQPWDVPDYPKKGDPNLEVTYCAVGRALSQWEWFEGNLSLIFTYVIGTGHGNVAAARAYGAVEVFRARKSLMEHAAEVYFRLAPDDELEKKLKTLLSDAIQLAGRRNDIAHGIVNPYFEGEVPKHSGWVLYPAYYATRKRKLSEAGPLTDVTLTYAYSSVEIDQFGDEFAKLGHRAGDILGDFHLRERQKMALGKS